MGFNSAFKGLTLLVGQCPGIGVNVLRNSAITSVGVPDDLAEIQTRRLPNTSYALTATSSRSGCTGGIYSVF